MSEKKLGLQDVRLVTVLVVYMQTFPWLQPVCCSSVQLLTKVYLLLHIRYPWIIERIINSALSF